MCVCVRVCRCRLQAEIAASADVSARLERTKEGLTLELQVYARTHALVDTVIEFFVCVRQLASNAVANAERDALACRATAARQIEGLKGVPCGYVFAADNEHFHCL